VVELRDAVGADATAIPGARSQFDVLVDGDLLFSKQATGRFPEDGEIVGLLEPPAA
jgi:predicted Rdx family selenoprotein